jgi:hypothetical protein
MGDCEGQCKRQNIRVSLRPSQTCYPYDDDGEDPNRDWVLCEECADEYSKIMDEQWSNYYGGCL